MPPVPCSCDGSAAVGVTPCLDLPAIGLRGTQFTILSIQWRAVQRRKCCGESTPNLKLGACRCVHVIDYARWRLGGSSCRVPTAGTIPYRGKLGRMLVHGGTGGAAYTPQTSYISVILAARRRGQVDDHKFIENRLIITPSRDVAQACAAVNTVAARVGQWRCELLFSWALRRVWGALVCAQLAPRAVRCGLGRRKWLLPPRPAASNASAGSRARGLNGPRTGPRARTSLFLHVSMYSAV